MLHFPVIIRYEIEDIHASAKPQFLSCFCVASTFSRIGYFSLNDLFSMQVDLRH